MGRTTESLAAIKTSTAASHHQARRDSGFQLEQTGHYAFDFSIGGFDGTPGTFPERFCRFNLDLRAADGHRVHLADGVENTSSWPSGAFLGAGQWTVEMETTCEWELTIKPMIGPSGGSARWF